MTNFVVLDVIVNKVFPNEKCVTILGSYFVNKDKKTGNNNYANVKCIVIADFLQTKATSITEKTWLNIVGKIGSCEVNEYKGTNSPSMTIWVQELNILAKNNVNSATKSSVNKNYSSSKDAGRDIDEDFAFLNG